MRSWHEAGRQALGCLLIASERVSRAVRSSFMAYARRLHKKARDAGPSPARTRAARDKGYQNEELTLAVEQLRLFRPDHSWLIPVRFDACDIPDRDIGGGRTLSSIQRADLFGEDLHRRDRCLGTAVPPRRHRGH